jgi:hypothetical protein
MPDLYECILDVHPTQERLKIGHWFESLMGEYGAGDLSGAEATTAFEALSGRALTATMQQEIQDLIGTVTAIPAPAAPAVLGNNPSVNALRDYARAWGERDQGLALRAHKIRRIMQILELATAKRYDGGGIGAPGYDTPALLRTRLGVPTR